MRVSPLFHAWSTYLESRLPCSLEPGYLMTKEHIAPKSLFPPILTNDQYNIIPFPKRLNNARSNYPYTNTWKDGYAIYACTNCPTPGFCRGAMIKTPDGYNPPTIFKGPIARSVLYNSIRFPDLSQKLNKEVLDLNTAREWNLTNPMSPQEKAWWWTLEQ